MYLKTNKNRKYRREYRKMRWHKFRSQSLCGRCGIRTAGFALCLHHRMMASITDKAYYQRKKEKKGN